MTQSVFVSYSTDDIGATVQIYASLEAAGVPTWMAPRNIVPGLDYGAQIVSRIFLVRCVS